MKKLLWALCALVITATLLFAAVSTVSAETYTGTVNLAKADRNLRGSGYYWNNPDRILTLNGLDVDTEDDFGFKLPPDARVVLEGSNRIKAGKYALGCQGSVIFEGSGSLTVESAEAAIYSYSTYPNHKLHFTGGEYTVTGGEVGILSDGAEIIVTGGTLSITSGGECALKGRVFSFTGGSVTASGAVDMTHLINVNRAKLEISAKGAALVSGNIMELKNMKLFAGDSSESLLERDDYNGESYFATVPEKGGGRRSIFFGDEYSGLLDYAVILGAMIIVSAGIAVPVIRKKRKIKKLYESLGK